MVSVDQAYMVGNMKNEDGSINKKNVVILSEEAYNNLMENAYVTGNKANYDWLMESKAQLEKGKSSVHNLAEVFADE